MRLLAIDPGSNEVGLYWGPGTRKTLKLYETRLPVKTPRPRRLNNLAKQLADAVFEFGPFDFAVYEEQFVRGGPATKALYGAVGVLEAVLDLHEIGIMALPQSTVRRWAKQQLPVGGSILGAKLLYSAVASIKDPQIEQRSEHEDDACVLWHFTRENGETNGRN